MKANDLRKMYLEFFESKDHKVIPSASLIPENDPTVLFTTAGMHPLVLYLMGEKHPEGSRLVNSQKCIRTGDIDEVGNTTHHTFFEMLGNWSLGDYWKKDAIEWSYEFLTSNEWLNLEKEKIAVSVFKGDDDAPFDEESYKIWKSLGIPEKRIAKLGKKDNWWGPAGETGPCGPDSEMFYWVGSGDVPESFDPDDKNWVEIWNDVFMEYEKKRKTQNLNLKTNKEEFEYVPLKQKNVDTGMGFERVLAVINGSDDNYTTELYAPLIEKIEELSSKKYTDDKKAMRIIADHIKAATFIISEGIEPSNKDQGYVVRRLVRRAIRYGNVIGINDNFSSKLSNIVHHIYSGVYDFDIDSVNRVINEEEIKFRKTLVEGLKIAKEILDKKKPIDEKIYSKIMQIDAKGEILKKIYHSDDFFEEEFPKHGIEVTNKAIKDAYITGKEAFYLYQSFGFPIEMIIELAQAKKVFVTITDFRAEVKKHQDLSRTASAGKFKGGLADAGDDTKKLHTAAHLLLAALKKVLGDHVEQKGSNITAERLRFDFSHSEKLTDEERAEVEKLVNDIIDKNLPITLEELSLDDAKASGATGVFSHKYGNKVKVYTIGNPLTHSTGSGQADSGPPFSREICGGPHAEKTGDLGKFKITNEKSSSSGVRRIKAILE